MFDDDGEPRCDAGPFERLADEHKIRIDTDRVSQPEDAYAVPWARMICIPPIRSAVGYATAVHELAHLIETTAWGEDPAAEIAYEQAAWRWARDNAIAWTPSMERCAGESLTKRERRLREEEALRRQEEESLQARLRGMEAAISALSKRA